MTTTAPSKTTTNLRAQHHRLVSVRLVRTAVRRHGATPEQPFIGSKAPAPPFSTARRRYKHTARSRRRATLSQRRSIAGHSRRICTPSSRHAGPPAHLIRQARHQTSPAHSEGSQDHRRPVGARAGGAAPAGRHTNVRANIGGPGHRGETRYKLRGAMQRQTQKMIAEPADIPVACRGPPGVRRNARRRHSWCVRILTACTGVAQ